MKTSRISYLNLLVNKALCRCILWIERREDTEEEGEEEEDQKVRKQRASFTCVRRNRLPFNLSPQMDTAKDRRQGLSKQELINTKWFLKKNKIRLFVFFTFCFLFFISSFSSCILCRTFLLSFFFIFFRWYCFLPSFLSFSFCFFLSFFLICC